MLDVGRRRESRERIWACSDPPAVLSANRSGRAPGEPADNPGLAPHGLTRSTADGCSARSSGDSSNIPEEPVSKLPEHMLALAPHGDDANEDLEESARPLRKRDQLGGTKNKIPRVLGAALSENKLQEEEDPLMSALRQALRLELGQLLSNRGKFHEIMREEVRGALTDIRNEAMKMTPRSMASTPEPVSPGLPPRRSSRRSTEAPVKEGKLTRIPSNKSNGGVSDGEGGFVSEEAKEYLSEIVRSMARHTDERDSSVQGSKASWAQWLEEVLDSCGRIKEPPRTGQLANVIQSKAFEAIVLAVIFVNCGYMAYSVDYGVKNPGQTPPSEAFADWYFQIFYTMELVLKLIVHRAYFFVNKSWKANWFDACLVVTGLMGFIQSDSVGGGLSGSFLRIIRIAKLGRTMRIVRAMSELKHLRAFLVCLQGSFMSFFWSLVMLLCVLFIFSLFMLQILGGYLADNDMQLTGWLETMYGGVLQSILTLFRASTGGDDWAVAYEVIAQTGAFGSFIYLVFIAFTQLALINIITGIFVESAMQTLRPDREMITMEQRRIESDHATEMELLCQAADADGSGTISPQEFAKMLARGRLPRLLTLLGLSKHHVVDFFTTMSELSPETEGEVDIRSFVQACMQLKGAATNFDVQMIHAELRSMWQKSDSRLCDISEKLYALESLIEGYEHSDAGSNDASEGPSMSA